MGVRVLEALIALLLFLASLVAAGVAGRDEVPPPDWTVVHADDGALDVVVVSLLVPR